MTLDEKSLLLTTARLLRAHLQDHKSPGGLICADFAADLENLNEDLAPFDPLPGEPVNQGSI